jgi:prepilin-type N-terminal cleavage/methylation domain-containing protein
MKSLRGFTFIEVLTALAVLSILLPVVGIVFYNLFVTPPDQGARLKLNNEVAQLSSMLYNDGHLSNNFSEGTFPYYGNFTWTDYSVTPAQDYLVSYYATCPNASDTSCVNHIVRQVGWGNASTGFLPTLTPTPTPTPTPTSIPATGTYTYCNGGGTDKWAWAKAWTNAEWFTSLRPTSPDNFFDTSARAVVDADVSSYSYLCNADNSSWDNRDTTPPVDYGVSSQLYTIKVNQNRSTVNNLSVTWRGYGGAFTQNTKLKIWNYTAGSWSTIVNLTDPGSKTIGTYTNTISTNPSYYIDASTGYVTLLASSDTNNVTPEDTDFGTALLFNGVDNSVTTSPTVPTNTFTFEAWVKATEEITMYSEATSGAAGVSGQHYVFWPTYEGDFDAGVGLSVGTNGISVYEHGNGYLPPLAVYNGSVGTAWNHIAVVYSSDVAKIYLNGNLVRTGLTSTKGIAYAPNTIGYGADWGSGSSYFNGVIDEVRVWNDVRTAPEILANMYREIPNPTAEANLTGYWQCSNNVSDISGHGNDGTLSTPPPQYVDSLDRDVTVYTDYIALTVNILPTPTPTPTPAPTPITTTFLSSGTWTAPAGVTSIDKVLVVAGGGAGGGVSAAYYCGAGGGAGGLIYRTNYAIPDTYVVTFTTVGTTTWTVPAGVTSAEVLVVGGGGAGGGRHGGGGAGGGLVYNANYAVTAGAGITVTVGAGGLPRQNSPTEQTVGYNGANSVFGSITALGGGGGGSYTAAVPTGGGSGGGGGGGSGGYPTHGLANQGDSGGGTGYGYNGGDGSSAGAAVTGGGGGGGAGAIGSNAAGADTGGNGGAGKYIASFSAYGVSGYFAGGGGGGGNTAGGTGGSGGGGNGGINTGTTGTANTGGGGGGVRSATTSAQGKAGGSGVVIIRYTTRTFTVTVGDGGTASTGRGGNGGPSVFGSITATGGGGGGRGVLGDDAHGVAGGSGGGGGQATCDSGDAASGTSGQGNNGGNGLYHCWFCSNAGGGGGGNTSPGAGGDNSNGGAGGSGTDYSATFGAVGGASGKFAGGGGGAGCSTSGAGGLGGGGAGAPSLNGVAGLANTGGGGGGAYSGGSAQTGGAGGSGIVIIQYTINYKTLTTSASTGGTVTVSPGLSVPTGERIYITATKDQCYQFVNWTGSGVTASKVDNASAASTFITMSADYDVKANFAPITSNYSLSLTPDPAAGGSPIFTGDSPFSCGFSVPISANPAPGYSFGNWTPTAGVANPNASDTTVLMTDNRILTAHYNFSAVTPSPTPITYNTTMYLTWHITANNFSLRKITGVNGDLIVANISAGVKTSMGKYVEKQLTIYIQPRPVYLLPEENIWGEDPVSTLSSFRISGTDTTISGDLKVNGTVTVVSTALRNAIDGTLTCPNIIGNDLAKLSYTTRINGSPGNTMPDIGLAQSYFTTNLSAGVQVLDDMLREYVFTGNVTLEYPAPTGVWLDSTHLKPGLYYSPGTITLKDSHTRGTVTFIAANQIIIWNDDLGTSYDTSRKIALGPYSEDLLLWANGSTGITTTALDGDILIRGGTSGHPCVALEGVLFAPNGEIELAGSGMNRTFFISRAELYRSALIAKNLTISGNYWSIYRW